ncbi:hypothetical protein EVAR_29431_1 [Eumeta japonica]|uniref:Uncharacterized protein n=1 Tax=Eumeta variegata TaxID=151549 RepID=A0A4C1VSG5_EUMVA|nr:hypothetical protein EVAR_29431_1 [Eumeta japonica]
MKLLKEQSDTGEHIFFKQNQIEIDIDIEMRSALNAHASEKKRNENYPAIHSKLNNSFTEREYIAGAALRWPITLCDGNSMVVRNLAPCPHAIANGDTELTCTASSSTTRELLNTCSVRNKIISYKTDRLKFATLGHRRREASRTQKMGGGRRREGGWEWEVNAPTRFSYPAHRRGVKSHATRQHTARTSYPHYWLFEFITWRLATRIRHYEQSGKLVKIFWESAGMQVNVNIAKKLVACKVGIRAKVLRDNDFECCRATRCDRKMARMTSARVAGVGGRGEESAGRSARGAGGAQGLAGERRPCHFPMKKRRLQQQPKQETSLENFATSSRNES